MIIKILKKQKRKFKVEEISKKIWMNKSRLDNLLRKGSLYKETDEEAQLILEYLLSVQEGNQSMIEDWILHYNHKKWDETMIN